MPEEIAEHLVSILIPSVSERVAEHHRRAVNAIEGMSPSRQRAAEANVGAWRRWVKDIDPSRENGLAFSGVELTAGATASLPINAVVVACDMSWARAKWSAGCYIKPTVTEASLYEVTSEGLKQLTTSVRRRWPFDLVHWLVANRPGIPVTTIIPPRGAQ